MESHGGVLRTSLIAVAWTLGTVAPPHAALAKERVPPRIECDVSIPCTVDEAWAAWTTTEGLESFLARSARVTLEEGGEYVIDVGGGRAGLDHDRPPRILQMDTPRALSFEWVIPLPRAASRDPKTVVTVRIEPISPLRCRVRLEHSGWMVGEEATEEFAYSRQSWKVVLRDLRSALTVRGRGR